VGQAGPTAARHHGCCSAADAADARRVADLLGIPFYALNFEEEFGRIVENTRKELAKEKDPLQKIRTFAIMHLNIVSKQQQLGEVLGVEVRQSTKFMKEYINNPFIEYLNLIRSIVVEGQEKGLIRKDLTPGIMKRALFGALDEMARYWVLSTKKKHSINEAALQISEVFIRGVMNEGAWGNHP